MTTFIPFTVGDLIETFKTYLHFDSIKNFILSLSNFIRHDYNFKPRSKLLVRSGFFTNLVTDEWNALPFQVINAQSVDKFKNTLDVL